MEKDAFTTTALTACGHLKRRKPESRVSQEIVSTFSNDYRVLPLYEKKLYDYTRLRHYSMRRNHLLACRWRRHVDTNAGRKRSPFRFPRVDDFHFYNYHTRFAPAQSITGPHPRRLPVGPGVDSRGQMPIPADISPRHRPPPADPAPGKRA